MHGCSQDNMAAPSMETLERAAARTIELARERGLTLGCAESCTGGLVSAVLTRIPGSSAVVRGGVVSYALDVKHAVLGVDQAILDDPAQGAVCAQCARQMARGATSVLGCDVAVSVTGIAGPKGAEPGKPVGTVWFGLCGPRGTRSVHRLFSGDRQEVRDKAVAVALDLMCGELGL